MKTPSENEIIIASRTFERDDGEAELYFYRPLPWPSPLDADPNDPPWRCRFRIDFPGNETKWGYAIGIDGVQALLLAVRSAQHSLQYVGDGTPTRRPDIRWHGEDDLGLTIHHFD